jgi:hypothetical protein
MIRNAQGATLSVRMPEALSEGHDAENPMMQYYYYEGGATKGLAGLVQLYVNTICRLKLTRAH